MIDSFTVLSNTRLKTLSSICGLINELTLEGVPVYTSLVAKRCGLSYSAVVDVVGCLISLGVLSFRVSGRVKLISVVDDGFISALCYVDELLKKEEGKKK